MKHHAIIRRYPVHIRKNISQKQEMRRETSDNGLERKPTRKPRSQSGKHTTNTVRSNRGTLCKRKWRHSRKDSDSLAHTQRI